MTSSVGPLTKHFFKKCGYKDAQITSWSAQTRLLQDIGLAGDSAWEEFTTMHREFGVDLTGFEVGRYFPPEVSHDTFILRLFAWTKCGRRVKEKYPPITLEMVEEVLRNKRWKYG